MVTVPQQTQRGTTPDNLHATGRVQLSFSFAILAPEPLRPMAAHNAWAASGLLRAVQRLTIAPKTASTAAAAFAAAPSMFSLTLPMSPLAVAGRRAFSATAVAAGTWLEPSLNRKRRMMKGRPRVATGGSVKGTTIVWGDYGLRMCDHHRRISAAQLKVAEDTIKQRLRGQRYRLYKRVNCNIGVFISGNEIRMGKGKGSFDHWASRVAVNRVIFEIRGAIHEQVARDAFRLAGNKMPGQYEFVKKGDPPIVGITKLEDGLTLEDLKRPWQLPAAQQVKIAEAAATSNSTTPAP
ncbi:mitochondrial large ribosomal subunit [Grosmannia clavigera kw1407]|uniref:Mitochondrial large ribosomal subunit n=1 Tax=Grosmannia clavigera (strain kw1407 / UAMH 11150) TaxID=655863 RepID=F0XTX6_GROCL|nr:mitochondrial large ribosomal subunit [Grosmannia clavigera kw1407]EFW99053.1 mitochondrial large ribosomal subunit [Grosmannia clavigera kw1407]